MIIANHWKEYDCPIRLYLRGYTVAGELLANVYIMPWPRAERRQCIEYASAVVALGMATSFYIIESVG